MAQKNLLQSAGDVTAVPSGYVGESLTASSTSDFSQSNPVQGTVYDLGPTLTITPGKWLIMFSSIATTTRATGTGGTYLNCQLRDSSNNVLYGNYTTVNSGFAENWAAFSGSLVFTTTTGTTLKTGLLVNQNGAVNTYSILTNRGSQGIIYITALRIA